MTVRNKLADLLEETARSRRASSRSSAVIGRTLKHFGVAKAMKAVAGAIRVDDQEGDG
ncbi:hypothetical protein BJ1_gp13 [Halorubrum virus BJ1]|uniref:Uncharacterized protein n=1 Tax=Halorubrum virus BJ1 TaxID=416419 RepID=A0ZYM6_9CAUD|nr:hypothetical protein BJ1_gp13 [Halorubrum virus BJ1]CAL92435.1 hypothetical protein [Halorubrum virus BJ1]